jgi:protoporphyrinogen oxidase
LSNTVTQPKTTYPRGTYPESADADPKELRSVIIGAGPAGLTAGFELLTRTNIRPVILEKSRYMGGLSRTVNYKGNRIDIGGHRFFSKSDRVMRWWLDRMPLQQVAGEEQKISYRNMQRGVQTGPGPDPAVTDRVMLLRPRKSRIYYLRRFFEYPITLSRDTLTKLGVMRTARIGFSYIKSMMRPIRPETSLEEFFINRFGRELYRTFFKSYTEKVWGVPCNAISAEWGAQRIKGLSITKTLAHAAKKLFPKRDRGGLAQKQVETSLIEQFMYPKFGPGQMWEEVARSIRSDGGNINTGLSVESITHDGTRVTAVRARNEETGEVTTYRGSYFFSTMPIQELIRALEPAPPANVREVSDGLVYRDFITVGLLLNDLKIKDDSPAKAKLIQDNWIYVQEPDVQIGRLQIFNNWSPFLVADPTKVWLGLEYFCNETDPIWKLPDEEMIALAKKELSKIGIIEETEVLDGTVLRVPKTYPAYFGTYSRFDEIRSYIDTLQNLFLIGRNGMHKYNNQDHSMLTAMTAVDNIIAGRTDKGNIWEVNTEQDYHEQKQQEKTTQAVSA